MSKPHRSPAVGAPSSKHPDHSHSDDPGVRVIKIPRGELYKDPFRYVSAPPTMPGEKTGKDTSSDE